MSCEEGFPILTVGFFVGGILGMVHTADELGDDETGHEDREDDERCRSEEEKQDEDDAGVHVGSMPVSWLTAEVGR